MNLFVDRSILRSIYTINLLQILNFLINLLLWSVLVLALVLNNFFVNVYVQCVLSWCLPSSCLTYSLHCCNRLDIEVESKGNNCLTTWKHWNLNSTNTLFQQSFSGWPINTGFANLQHLQRSTIFIVVFSTHTLS